MASMVSTRVISSAAVAGAVGFVAGFVGPLLIAPSNLAPLIGIFITGPLGVLLGALWGIARSTRNADAQDTRIAARWLVVVWAATLLFTLVALELSAASAVWGLGAQALILLTAVSSFSGAQARASGSARLPRCETIVFAAMVVIALMTAFPPVVRPSWVPDSRLADAGAVESIPRFTFLLDTRLDASRRFPQLAVDRSALVVEWALTLLGATTLCLVDRWRRGRQPQAPRMT